MIAFFLLTSTVGPALAQEASSRASTEESDTRAEASPLTASERAQSQQWALSDTEWRRYKTLMQGIRGRLSPDISPIEALGIHARSDAERQRYAQMWAKAMREDTERVLQFQRAYDAAWRRLYGNEPLIDPAKLARARHTLLQPGDRILFFTRSGCTDCDTLLQALLAKVRQVPRLGLDIYLVDSDNDDGAVRQWADAHAIPTELVQSRAVTLNHDNGTLMQVSGLTGTVPYIVRRRGEQLARIQPEMLHSQ
ncbi:MAG: TIGR03759 family integrating conjugative element protein [Gammaproteobacteria bacterium]|nr:TIGR03759 family integrating conjugative element protein [Gammaproteobacteria bacterium]